MNITIIQKSLDSLTRGRITVSNGQPNSISLHGNPVNYHEIQHAISAARKHVSNDTTINIDDVLNKLRLREEISQAPQPLTPGDSSSSIFIG